MTAKHVRKPFPVRKLVFGLLALLVLAAGSFGGYWLFFREDKQPATSGLTATPVQKDNPSQAAGKINTATKHHVSTGFMVEFTYPKDWTIADAEDGSQLTATSPGITLKDTNNKTFVGQVVFTIRNKQQALPEFDRGNAVAARESEKINYTQPSSVQRGSTYVSFLRYAGSQPGSLNGVYVTGNVGYKVAQAIPKADFVPVDPIVSVTFKKCAASRCDGQSSTATGIAPTMWEDTAFGGQLRTMLQSLVIN
jgi:hypothetical protein